MAKDYSIKGTTKIQREKYVNDAIALSTLDALAPSEMAMKLAQEYIDGKCELDDAHKRIIKHYKVATSA
jgi:hypothetical protein